MGKLLEKYMAEYNAAIKSAKPGDYVIRPEIWIHSKWEEDMGLDGPWQPEYAVALEDVTADDLDLCNVLLNALGMKMKTLEEMEAAESSKTGKIWDETTQRYT